MKILVLGADGYLGWPQCCYFAKRGHDVLGVDNFARRNFHTELGADSLTPIQSMEKRQRAWEATGNKPIQFRRGDLCDWGFTEDVIATFKPDAIVHYGEQPSAPYSMIDREHCVFSQVNNVVGNLNVLWAMKMHAPGAHLVKLGTMGEYGTPNIDIEEGYIEIEHKGRKDTLPFPKTPGSFYHLSKVHDSNNIMFACRMWGIKATDLNQGIVYGIETDEIAGNEALNTRFDYNSFFGTALNRFCTQAVAGIPLTVYGNGSQTRGYLNIRDTMRCVELACENTPEGGKMRVFNQMTECFSIKQLAELVQKAGAEFGLKVDVQAVDNPRIEAEDHYFNPVHTALESLGLTPTHLNDELVRTVLGTIQKYKDRIDTDQVMPRATWK